MQAPSPSPTPPHQTTDLTRPPRLRSLFIQLPHLGATARLTTILHRNAPTPHANYSHFRRHSKRLNFHTPATTANTQLINRRSHSKHRSTPRMSLTAETWKNQETHPGEDPQQGPADGVRLQLAHRPSQHQPPTATITAPPAWPPHSPRSIPRSRTGIQRSPYASAQATTSAPTLQ